MAKFMVIGNYNAEGIKGVLKGGGTARVDAVREACKGVGGSVESFYFAFGGEDVFVVCDLPDNAAAAALAMNVSSAGLVSIRTIVLLTPSEVDEAAKLQVSYKPPGK
jgi:uncharacterized protein with GYD domain